MVSSWTRTLVHPQTMPFDPTLPRRSAPEISTADPDGETDLSPFDARLSDVAPFDSASDVDLLLHDIPVPDMLGASAKRVASNGTADGASGDGRAVLVVDRSPIARKFLMQRLRSLGYVAHSAQDGEEALEMVERQAFAIVFSEVLLAPKGGLDGLRLCQAIKQKPDHPSGATPAVVMVTKLRGSSDRVRGSLAGCDAYLTKPLRQVEFVAALVEVDPLFA
jgi:CheY-like chemotaxis protein